MQHRGAAPDGWVDGGEGSIAFEARNKDEPRREDGRMVGWMDGWMERMHVLYL